MTFFRSMSLSVAFCVLVCFPEATACNIAAAQGIAIVEGNADAKGIVLLRATLPSGSCPRYITLRVSGASRNAEEELTMIINGAYVASEIIDDKTCSLLLPAFAGPTDYGDIGFAFSRPGTYTVLWQFGSTGVSPVDSTIEQTVEVGVAASADLHFIERLSRPELLRILFGDDFFDRQTETVREGMLSPSGADERALKVIGQLLKATREKWAGNAVRDRKSEEEKRRWADSLLGLAKEIPNSSYAPYAAYYAGCCYSTIGMNAVVETVRARRQPGERKDRAKEARQRFALAESNPDCTKAMSAFEMAANRADEYLKPRAVYQQAFIAACRGDVTSCEKLIADLEKSVGQAGEMRDRVTELSESLDKFKKTMPNAQPVSEPVEKTNE